MEGTLKVTPAKLKDTSGRFSSKAAEVKQLHDDMISKIDSLSSAWTGTAAESYRNKFKSLQASMDQINRMIMEHSRDLTAMAEQYEAGESKAESIASELPASTLD